LIDCSISFLLVIAFSAVFVACGTIVLGPAQQIPDASRFLDLQARFVTHLHPWLLPLYVTGALLTMVGTLYGTLEVACHTASEIGRAICPDRTARHERRLKIAVIAWCATGAGLVLAWLFLDRLVGGHDKPRLLLAILTPANLFTGVLFCGLLALLAVWSDRRFLPKGLAMPWGLCLLNLLAGVVFLGLGLKGYWDDPSRTLAIIAGAGAVGVALVGARWLPAARRGGHDSPPAKRPGGG